MQEKISALMDGELSGEDAESVIGDFEDNRRTARTMGGLSSDQ